MRPHPTIRTFASTADFLRSRGYMIDGTVFAPPRRLFIRDIQEAVAKVFEIRIEEMWSARRGHDVAHPRQAAMYLAKELTAISLPEIGRRFGNRDHTTVIHAVRAVEKRIAINDEFAVKLAQARRELGR